MTPSTKENVSDTSTWMRGLFMLLFGVAFNMAEVLVLAVAVLQFLCSPPMDWKFDTNEPLICHRVWWVASKRKQQDVQIR